MEKNQHWHAGSWKQRKVGGILSTKTKKTGNEATSFISALKHSVNFQIKDQTLVVFAPIWPTAVICSTFVFNNIQLLKKEKKKSTYIRAG